MSRHIVTTTYQNRPIEVVAGWDRPLQYYFLTIQFLDIPEENDDQPGFLYSNLDDSPQDLPYYQAITTHYQIALPATFWSSIEEDGRLNRGNRIVRYRDDGTSLITPY